MDVFFLITDIEHSSQLWHEAPTIMREVIQVHDQLVSTVVKRHGGTIFRHAGDGIFATFPPDGDVLHCALEIQEQINRHEWPVRPFRLRIALHYGQTQTLSLPRQDGFLWQKQEPIGPHAALTEVLVNHTRGGYITFTGNVLTHCPLPAHSEAIPLQTLLFWRLPPQQLFTLKHPSLPSETEAALRAPLPTFELPYFEGSFLGREVELGQLRVWLEQSAHRLISIVGPSGVGKSRLAGELAQTMLAFFPAGIVFLNLEPPTPHFNLAQRILQALHIPLPRRSDEALPALIQALDRRRMLLILDSWPGTATDRHILQQLLQQTHEPRFLVTALLPLGLAEEQTLQLQGLPVPPPTSPPEAIEGYAAVNLFLEHARRRVPHFQVNASCRRAIQRICQSVDGYPLAIELAASWVGILSCDTIAAEIEKDLAFLQTDDRDRPQRHSSLRAAFDHTWRYLPSDLQQACLQLAIFQTAFSAEDARLICGVSKTQLHTLYTLGLLRRESGHHYRFPLMLNRLIRERWATAQPDVVALHQRFAVRFCTLLERFNQQLKGGGQFEAIQAMERSWETLVAAFQHALLLGWQPETLARAAEALFLFLFFRNWFEEGQQLFQQAVQTHSPHSHRSRPHRVLQAELLALQGWFQHRLGSADGLRLIEEAQTLFQPQEAPHIALLLANLRGYLYWHREQPAMALQAFQDSVELAQQLQDRWHLAFALNYQGNAWLDQQHHQEALHCYQAALGIRESLHDRIGEAITLNNLGYAYKTLQQYDRALSCFQQSLQISHHNRQLAGMALAMINLGDIALQQQQYELALRWLHDALEIRQQMGIPTDIARVLQMLGITHYRQGNLESATRYLHSALTIFQAQPVAEYLAHTRIHLGIVAWMQQNLSLARHQLQQGMPRASSWGQALASLYCFHVELADGRPEAALPYLQQAGRQSRPDLVTELVIALCVWQAYSGADAQASHYLLALLQQQQLVAPHAYTIRFWLQRLGASPPPDHLPLPAPEQILAEWRHIFANET